MTKYINIKELEDINILDYDEKFLEKTLSNRMQATNKKTLESYIGFLQNSVDELLNLKKALRNTYSEFFRNKLAFSSIEHIILPELVKRKRAAKQKEIRIWSAACASGQEAYSLAILCNEISKSGDSDIRFRIFATDILASELENARLGIYNEMALNNVTLKRIKENFKSNGSFYSLSDEIKRYVDFSMFDLLDESRLSPTASIYGDFDIILCSNILFYYGINAQKKIIEKITGNLVKNGYLIVGEAEISIIENNINYIYNAKNAIFCKPW